MKYMLLLYSNESAAPQDPEELQSVQADWMALLKDAKRAGVLIDNNGLSSVNDATTVRVRDGKTMTTDGPFAETHEQMGGYFLINCKDLDEAISWASRIPHAKYGSVEIRPMWSPDA